MLTPGQVVSVRTLDGPRPVTAFRLDDDARDVFFHGQCAALAVAVADRTGWGVRILFNNPEAVAIVDQFGFDSLVEAQRQRTLLVDHPEAEPSLELDHFVVEAPGGDWLDVPRRGIWTGTGVSTSEMWAGSAPGMDAACGRVRSCAPTASTS